MAESSVAVPEKDGVVISEYVWGTDLGSKGFKSVTVDGEEFSLGDCVRCKLKSKPGHIGKIVKLFEMDGKGMCRVRSFSSPSEFAPSVKGLDHTPGPKELFLAAGEGLGVEKDMSLGQIAGRCIIFCIAKSSFNAVPSPEQVEAADYFFRLAYDPDRQEVVGLDIVEENIGAQKLFNKKEWLIPVDNTDARSSPQVHASRIQRQSPAVSGSSSHQGAAKGMSASLSEVSPAPSGDSAEQKLKKRKIDNVVPEPPEVDAAKKTKELQFHKNEMSAGWRGKPNAHSEHLVFALPAPSKVNPSQRLHAAPVMKGKPPTSSASKAKATKPGGKGESTSKANAMKLAGKGESTSKGKAVKPVGKGGSMSMAKATQPQVQGESLRVSSSSIAPIGSMQKAGIKEGAMSGVKKRKHESIPGTEGPRNKILKPTERFYASVEREKPSDNQKRAHEVIARASSPTAEQKPRGPIFKPKDWDAANLVPAIQNNRVLLLENVATGLHSDDLAEALTLFFDHRCEVRIAPPESSSFRTTSALVKFASPSIAIKINETMNSRNVIVSGRLVTTKFFKYGDFKAKLSTSIGHIELPKEGRNYNNEDYRAAVATSHLAQGNTIEFDYGLPWRVLDDQHDEQWRMLQEEFNNSKSIAPKKIARK